LVATTGLALVIFVRGRRLALERKRADGATG
jgi:hypothetical protein